MLQYKYYLKTYRDLTGKPPPSKKDESPQALTTRLFNNIARDYCLPLTRCAEKKRALAAFATGYNQSFNLMEEEISAVLGTKTPVEKLFAKCVDQTYNVIVAGEEIQVRVEFVNYAKTLYHVGGRPTYYFYRAENEPAKN